MGTAGVGRARVSFPCTVLAAYGTVLAAFGARPQTSLGNWPEVLAVSALSRVVCSFVDQTSPFSRETDQPTGGGASKDIGERVTAAKNSPGGLLEANHEPHSQPSCFLEAPVEDPRPSQILQFPPLLLRCAY